MKRLALILFFTIAVSCAFAQKDTISKAQLDSVFRECFDSLSSPSFFKMLDNFESKVKESGYRDFEYKTPYIYSIYYYLNGDSDSLRKYVEQTKILTRRDNLLQPHYYMWNYLISNYVLSGQTEHAVNDAQAMLESAERDNYPYGIALSFYSLGDIYSYLKLYEEAIDNFNKAIEHFGAIEDPELAVVVSSDIGNIYFSLCVVNIHLERYNEIFPLCDKMEQRVKMLNPATNSAYYSYMQVCECARSIAHSRLGHTEDSKIHLDKAESYFKKRPFQKDYLLEAQGVYYEESQQYQKALDIYDQLIELYKKMDLNKERARFIYYKGSVYDKMGEYKIASKAYKGFIKLQDSLNADYNQMHLNEFAVMSNLKSVELEKKNLQLEVEKSNREKFIIAIILLITITIVITTSFLLEKRMNLKLKKSETDLKSALGRAEESDKLKSAFLANMSHEIRTPLNSIMGFSNLLTTTREPEEMELYSNIINNNSEMLMQLISDILDLSKMDSGSMALHRQEFDITQYFKDLIGSFQKQKADSPITLLCECSDEPHIVNLDKTRLCQLITNFLNNAFKFTFQGTITAGFTIQDGGVRIYVTDTGIGIPEEKLEIIFDRFVKLNDFTQGNGLGMSICKSIAEGVGGKIGVESKEGSGSTFWAWIPDRR